MRASLLLVTATVASVYLISLFVVHLYIHLSLDSPASGQRNSLTMGELPYDESMQVTEGMLPPEVLHFDMASGPVDATMNASGGFPALKICPEARLSTSSSSSLAEDMEKSHFWKRTRQRKRPNKFDGGAQPTDCVDLPEVKADRKREEKPDDFQPLGSDYLYSAYFDDRLTTERAVRIIALLKKLPRKSDVHSDLYCHFPSGPEVTRTRSLRDLLQLFHSVSVVSVPAQFYEMCENHGKDYGGWILSCKLPDDVSSPPCSVYVSAKQTISVNQSDVVRLRVQRVRSARSDTTVDQPTEENFGVCIPPLFGQITPRILKDFIRLTQILGADHLFFYAPRPFPVELHRVLTRYVHLGVVTVVPWTVPVPENSIWYEGQLLAINDCLYRSMRTFRFVAFNDLDEFIVPHRHAHWREMIVALRRTPPQPEADETATQHCGYTFKSAFFDPLTDVTSGSGRHRVSYELGSNLRTRSFSRIRNKLIVAPSLLFELGIHHLSRPLEVGKCSVVKVEPEVAFIHHYRECTTSFDGKMNCRALCQDDSMSTFLSVLRNWRTPANSTMQRV